MLNGWESGAVHGAEPFPPTLKRVLGILSVSETHNTLKLTIYYSADFAYLLSSSELGEKTDPSVISACDALSWSQFNMA